MDLGTLLGLLIAIGVPAVGGIITAGKLIQRIRDHDVDITELKERHGADMATVNGRLERAEEAVRQVGSLASAIEHLGQRVADQIGNLVDRIAQNDDHIKLQLADIKEDVRTLRSVGRRVPDGK